MPTDATNHPQTSEITVRFSYGDLIVIDGLAQEHGLEPAEVIRRVIREAFMIPGWNPVLVRARALRDITGADTRSVWAAGTYRKLTVADDEVLVAAGRVREFRYQEGAHLLVVDEHRIAGLRRKDVRYPDSPDELVVDPLLEILP